jgi:hypothetical protein
MKLIKLTDANAQTYGGLQWGEGVTHTVEWSGEFCAPGCIRVYKDLTVALLLNPIHADFNPVRAWEAEGEILADDHGLKVGVKSLTIIREIPISHISTTHRVAFGILCALAVSAEKSFVVWADGWLSNKDRSASAAAYVGRAAAYPVYAARAALYATYDAAGAAHAAAHAAAYAAYDAVRAAAYDADIDLIDLARRAGEIARLGK